MGLSSIPTTRFVAHLLVSAFPAANIRHVHPARYGGPGHGGHCRPAHQAAAVPLRPGHRLHLALRRGDALHPEGADGQLRHLVADQRLPATAARINPDGTYSVARVPAGPVRVAVVSPDPAPPW